MVNTELNVNQLRKSLQQAAISADQQIARLHGFDVPYEIADDFYNWCRWILNCPDVRLTNEQRSRLIELDNCLSHMSGKHNAELWTEEALRSRNEWDEVRRQAREILDLFGWVIEE